MLLDLDGLRDKQPRLYEVVLAPKQPEQEPLAAPTETLRPWQLPLNATEAQIRAASFLVRRDLAKRQHEAAVEANRRKLGSHAIKF